MINDTHAIEWIYNWIYAFEIGMLVTIILFALKSFENPRTYNYYHRFWLSALVLLTLFTFVKFEGMFRHGEWIIDCVILVYLASIAPATYQYRKKTGIVRSGDTLLFGVAIILYGWCNYLLISGVWSKHKHLLDW